MNGLLQTLLHRPSTTTTAPSVTGVAGSCHELTLHGPREEQSGILDDCGIFQGDEAAGRGGADALAIDFPTAHIRTLLVTHVHIDHVGRIPQLLAAGFDGLILCSPPSALMLAEVLEDALKIGFSRDARLIKRVLGQFCACIVALPFDQWYKVFDEATTPAGTLGIRRTQELLYEIEDIIFEAGDDPAWKQLDIVVDSPLAAEFTRLYRKLKPYWDEEATARVRQGRHPLSFDQLLVIDRHEDHLKAVDYLARTGRPCVVIAGSGMCAGGRVVNYLKAMLGDARNDVLFVGYQAAGTPGRDILTHGPRGGWVTLDGERYTIRAQIHQVGGYSAHAGQSDLLRFVAGIPRMPAEIRIVHGEDGAKAALKHRLEEAGAARVLVPGAAEG